MTLISSEMKRNRERVLLLVVTFAFCVTSANSQDDLVRDLKPSSRLFSDLGVTVGDVTYNLWPFFIIAAILYALRLGLLFGGEIDGGSGYGAPSGGGFDPFGFVGGIAGGFTGDNLIGTGYNTPQTGTGYNTPQTGYGTPQPQPSYGSPGVSQTTTANTQQQAVVNNQPLLFGDGTNLLGNGGSQAAYGGIYSRFGGGNYQLTDTSGTGANYQLSGNGGTGGTYQLPGTTTSTGTSNYQLTGGTGAAGISNYQLTGNTGGNYQLSAAPLNSPAVTYSTGQISYQQLPAINQQLLSTNGFQHRTEVEAAPANTLAGSSLYTFGQVLPNGQYNNIDEAKSLIGAASASSSGNSNNVNENNSYIFYTPNRRR